MRAQTRDAFRRALELSRSLADPTGRDVAQLLAAVSADVEGRVPPTQLVEPTGQSTLTLTTSLPSPNEIGPYPVQFPTEGWCIGVVAVVAEDLAYSSAVGMSLLEGGSNILFTSGSGEAFVSLAAFTGHDPDLSHAFRFRRRVNAQTRWSVKYKVLRSVLPAAGASGAAVPNGTVTYSPRAYFLFDADY